MLGKQTQSDLLRLAAQTNMPLAQIQQQAMAQAAMQQQAGVIEVPQVNFYPSRHSDGGLVENTDIIPTQCDVVLTDAMLRILFA